MKVQRFTEDPDIAALLKHLRLGVRSKVPGGDTDMNPQIGIKSLFTLVKTKK